MIDASTNNCRGMLATRALSRLSVASASLAAVLVVQPVLAQEAPAAAAVSTDADVVVTAQKREERLQNVPISIAVLGGKTLDKQAVGGTLEALASVPGISQTTSDAGGMTQVSIRGVSPAVAFGGGSSTVGYYIDSIPFGLVRSAAVPNTSDFDLSRIEVLRGPQGTLYGASALNGVIRIITNDADPSHFELKIRGGGAATQGGSPSFRGDAEINVPIIQDQLAIRVVGGVESQGGWINQPVRDVKNANRSLADNLRVKVDARPTDNLKIDLSAWFSHDHYDAAPYADSAGNQSTPLPQPGTTNYQAYNGKIIYDLPFMSISSATSYLNFKQKIHTDFSYLGVPDLQLFSSLPAKELTEEFLLNSKGSGPWRWSAGAFYRDAHDDRYQTLPVVLPGPISWRDSSKSAAAFGQITRTFADDHFELSGGLRYFHDDAVTTTLVVPGGFLPATVAKAHFHAVTPRVVATWLPSSQLTLYASYSQGFRSGLEQTPLTLVAAPLPPAGADKLHNYEVGAKGGLFDGFATFDTALYYIKWDNIQQAGDLLYNGVYISATVNGSSASGVGTDLSLTLHPVQGLQIGGSLSYSGLTFDGDLLSQGLPLYFKGGRLPFSPEYTAAAFADYAFAVSGKLDARFRISGNYSSRQILNITGGGGQLVNGNSVYKSGAPLFVNGSFDIANHHDQTVSIYVQNLTNWGGLLIPSPEVTTPFRPRPRTVGIQFGAKF